MDEESYDDDDFDQEDSPKPRKTLMNMIRRRTQHQRPSHGSKSFKSSTIESYHVQVLNSNSFEPIIVLCWAE